MIRLNLCDYRDAYIHVKATMILPNTKTAAALVNCTKKYVIFRNCTPFGNWISEINNTQVYDT